MIMSYWSTSYYFLPQRWLGHAVTKAKVLRTIREHIPPFTMLDGDRVLEFGLDILGGIRGG